jgi:molecular chaperone Hsp33
MGLGVTMTHDESAVLAAGFLVQILPGASDEEIDRVEENVRALPKLSSLALADTSCDALIDRLLDGLGSRERHTSSPIYYCPCTRERALRTLQLLGRAELREMVAQKESQQVRCQFCGRAYEFQTDEIGSVLPDA